MQINQFYGYWYILRIVGGVYAIDNIGIMCVYGVHWYFLRLSLV